MKEVSYLNIVYGDETAERIRQNMEETMSLYSHTLLSMKFEEFLCAQSKKEFEKIISIACTKNATEQKEYSCKYARQHKTERARKHRLESREKRLERRK